MITSGNRVLPETLLKEQQLSPKAAAKTCNLQLPAWCQKKSVGRTGPHYMPIRRSTDWSERAGKWDGTSTQQNAVQCVIYNNRLNRTISAFWTQPRQQTLRRLQPQPPTHHVTTPCRQNKPRTAVGPWLATSLSGCEITISQYKQNDFLKQNYNKQNPEKHFLWNWVASRQRPLITKNTISYPTTTARLRWLGTQNQVTMTWKLQSFVPTNHRRNRRHGYRSCL